MITLRGIAEHRFILRTITECSSCRYIRLTTLHVPHVLRPLINAPDQFGFLKSASIFFQLFYILFFIFVIFVILYSLIIKIVEYAKLCNFVTKKILKYKFNKTEIWKSARVCSIGQFFIYIFIVKMLMHKIWDQVTKEIIQIPDSSTICNITDPKML